MVQDRLTRIEIALFGWMGTNGLLGTSKDLSRRLATLEREAIAHQARAKTLVRIVAWAAPVAVALIGAMGVDGVSHLIAAMAARLR